ncbi:hypothetical protein CkaCkLH20_05431 [Colletotrichum karsti]|uniref:Xylanolytic transcriptional activator regulatory domain-containing protein n=1 Tax=Colletotrichum karsti TaxID=1095194 RepID=A0A9P6IEE9_9PEZI|nr:uncharacterized protein CkaCkLH20_05431 [Colletotrichum karsti]KAF9877165.1 hypothetical protein CkaCkLH20_05431 [Colletotrichum karsti]
MLSESDFWDGYFGLGTGEEKKISLLLFQGMLLASCKFVAPETISMLGYDGIQNAKDSFYRKAKLLYDLGAETSPVAKAQAALLLTFNTTGPEFHESTWLAKAIDNARVAKADALSKAYEASRTTVDGDESLRRLWWCCFIRDRFIALASKQKPSIGPAEFIAQQYVEAGSSLLCAEINRTRVYSHGTRERLVRVVDDTVRLCVAMTDTLTLAFTSLSPQSSEAACEEQYLKAGQALSKWFAESRSTLPAVSSSGAFAKEEDPVVLYTNVMLVNYFWTRIVLCQCQLDYITTSQQKNEDRIQIAWKRDMEKEMRSSATAIAACLARLNRLESPRSRH